MFNPNPGSREEVFYLNIFSGRSKQCEISESYAHKSTKNLKNYIPRRILAALNGNTEFVELKSSFFRKRLLFNIIICRP
ncbi:MAG TPA: hypothetical protein VFM18_03600 [Methanosarcina sp.]|nr:hypothetical protein [Methanosarcina sp.]